MQLRGAPLSFLPRLVGGTLSLSFLTLLLPCFERSASGAALPATSGPRILRQPESFNAASGGALVLSVSAEGKGPLTYQWKKDGVPLVGAFHPFLQISDVSEENAGTYVVEVGDGVQSVSSSGAVVKVVSGAPVLLGQTPSQSVATGSRQLLRVFVRGATSATYQWRKGGVIIPGATGATYLIDSAQPGDAGRYDVLLRNEAGIVQSAPIVLAVVSSVSTDFRNPVNRWLNLNEVVAVASDLGEDPLSLFSSVDLALDSAGNLFLSDAGNHVVRRVTPGGVASVVAGKIGEPGYADGTGEAARFDSPEGIALDKAGNLYVADTLNNAVRKISPQGQVSTLTRPAGDSAAENEMAAPLKVAVDQAGSVYVLDALTVRRVLPDRSTSVIPWAVQTSDFSDQPFATAMDVDAAGKLYVAAVEGGISKLFARGSGGALASVPFAGLSIGEEFDVPLEDLAFRDGLRLYASSVQTSAVMNLGEIGGTAGTASGPANLLGDAQIGMLPKSLALDASGTVYVFDMSSQAVLVGIPDGLPALSVQPSPVACKVDEPFALRVEVEGDAEVSFQWFKGNSPVAGATQAVLAIEKAQVADSGSYRVEVACAAGRVVSRSATVAVAPPGPSLAVLTHPGNGGSPVKFFKGTLASVKVVLNPAGPDALSTEFTVHAYQNGVVGQSAGISGIAPANGELSIPLRALGAGGTYVVRFKRRFADQTLQADSEPFAVDLLGIDSAAGTYEVLLRDASNGLLGDNALYRGVLTVTVSKTGGVSGRILYNEAPTFAEAPEGIRAYSCVARSFSSALTPAGDNPLKLGCTPKVGVGSSANRQKLQVELDFTGERPELNAIVTDLASAPDTEGCVSQGTGGLRCVTALSSARILVGTVNMTAAVGRYVIAADSFLPETSAVDNNLAQVFVQVLATGRVLWTTNLPGYAGAGSAGLAAADAETLVAQFYEGRTVLGSKNLSTNSLLGFLQLSKSDQTAWRAGFVGESGEGSLERQASFITRVQSNGRPTLTYSNDAFSTPYDATSNWSVARKIEFEAGDGCRWAGSTSTGLSAFLWPETGTTGKPFEVSVTDPFSDELFSWGVTVSTTGVVRVSPLTVGALQPVLTLRLDRAKGLWSGSYSWSGADPERVPKGVRRNLFGASVQSQGSASTRAKGWIEVGTLPSTKTASWELIESE